jgi:hypothetical protein
MLAKVTSCSLIGLDGAIVEVEVDMSRGLGTFTKEVPSTCGDIQASQFRGVTSVGYACAEWERDTLIIAKWE